MSGLCTANSHSKQGFLRIPVSVSGKFANSMAQEEIRFLKLGWNPRSMKINEPTNLMFKKRF